MRIATVCQSTRAICRAALSAVSLLSSLSLCAVPLRAQAVPPAPVSLAALQGLGALPVADQRRNPNQAQLRQWFQRNIELYRHVADGTFLGRSLATFNPGPSAYPVMQGAWGQIWGTVPGYHDIIWDTRANPGVSGYPAPISWIWPPEIGFGLQNGNVTEYGGSVNTCWHEGLHAILGQYALDEIDLNAFQGVRSGKFDQERREHVYINWAERTIDWIVQLQRFENLVRAAAAEQERYRSNGIPIDWAIEHYLWRDAWSSWSGMQTTNFGTVGGLAGKISEAMTPALRDQFFAYSGIRIPLRDEVVRFYMNGGVTNAADPIRNNGTPIRVPEWVLVPDYRRGRIIQLATAPAAPTCKVSAASAGQSASCTIKVDLVDTYSTAAMRSVRAGVARGTLRVSFFTPGDAQNNARELGDPDAKVSVRLAGNELASSIAKRVFGAVEVDLPALYRSSAAVPLSARLPNVSKPIVLEVEFTRGRVESLKADKRFGLSLKYKDADDPARGPAVYYDAEAIFFVTIHATGGAGTAGTTTQSATSAAGQGAASRNAQATARGASAATGPGWHLVNTFRRNDPPRVVDIDGNTWGVAQERGKLPWYWDYKRTEESNSAFAYTMHYTVGPDATWTDQPRVDATRARRFTWTVPPAFIPVNSALKVQVEISTAGSAATSDRDRPGLTYIPSKISELEHDGISYRMDYVMLPPDRGAWQKTLSDFSNDVGARFVRSLGPQSLVIPSPGDWYVMAKYNLGNALAVSVETESRWDRTGVVYQYEFRDAAAPPPATAEMTRQADAASEKDPDIDNEPPAQPPATSPSLPRKRMLGGEWYTHPSGDWRIWLRTGTQLTKGAMSADFDEVSSSLKTLRLRIWRGADTVWDAAGRPSAAAQLLSAKQAKLLADAPGATTSTLTLGSTPTIMLERSEPTGERRWEYWFAAEGRLYRADFVRSAGTTTVLPQHPGTSVLGTIEFLRGNQGGGTPRAPAAPTATPATTNLSVDSQRAEPTAPAKPSLVGRGEVSSAGGQSVVSLTNESRTVWTRCLLTIPGKRSYRVGSLPPATGRDYALSLFKVDDGAPELQGEALLQCVEGNMRFAVDLGVPRSSTSGANK